LGRERVLLGQLLEHFLVGGRSGLAPLQHGEVELLVEDLRELLRRRWKELAAGELEDLAEERVDLTAELVAELLQPGNVYADSGQFQIGQHLDQRLLDVRVETEQLGIAAEVLAQRLGEAARPLDQRGGRRTRHVHRQLRERRRLLSFSAALAELLQQRQLAGDA